MQASFPSRSRSLAGWAVGTAIVTAIALVQIATSLLKGDPSPRIFLRVALSVFETPVPMVLLSLAFERAIRAGERCRPRDVHSVQGTFDLDLSLTSIEASFGRTLARAPELARQRHAREGARA